MSNSSLAIILLAAGKGTRMKSSLAKVLHPIFGSPMISHVLRSTNQLASNNRIVVVGHQKDAVIQALAGLNCTFATQTEQLGTAHAVLAAKENLSPDCEDVIIFYGDMPLVRPEILEEMYNEYKQNEATLAFMTTFLDNPTHYGRVLCTNEGAPLRIVEEKDTNPEEKRIKEINTGIYCVKKNFLYQALYQVDSNNRQGELYLTDIVELAVNQGKTVQKYVTTENKDVLGVNSRVELAEAEQELRVRRNHEVMMSGVSLLSPNTTLISEESTVGNDTTLAAGVELRGQCSVGSNCLLDSGVILADCTVADGVRIAPYTYRHNENIAQDIGC